MILAFSIFLLLLLRVDCCVCSLSSRARVLDVKANGTHSTLVFEIRRAVASTFSRFHVTNAHLKPLSLR